MELIVVQGKNQESLWFDNTESGFVIRFGLTHTLEHLPSTGQYQLTYPDGSTTLFDDASGAFESRTSLGGDTITVTSYYSNGYQPATVERSSTVGGTVTTDRLQYVYNTDTGDPLLSNVTLQRKVNSGSWQNISRASYTYYAYQEDNGIEGDLKTVTTQKWSGSQWDDTGTSYFRYYTPLVLPSSSSSSSSSSGGGGDIPPQNPRAHLLKYVLEPDAFARLDADVADPFTASDATVAQYADYYFEYDTSRRVTRESVHGASQTFDFAYETSTNADGYNSWQTKTTETRTDGSQIIVFTNYAGQTMLTVLKDGTDEWIQFYQYDVNAKLLMHATAAAITGYDESSADLLDYNSSTGKYAYLRDSAGLIHTNAWHAASGYTTLESVQEGQLGTVVKVRAWEYVQGGGASGGGSSSSSSSGGSGSPAIWVTSKDIEYPDAASQTTTIETEYVYTWYADTFQIKQKTTTLPVVSTSQNGSGTAATKKRYFDEYGNPTWQMDERGFITLTEFDIPTRAITQQIQDVNTSVETGAPTGWVTPSGGGLNLVTDFEHDDRGRMTQSLGPSHTIDLSGTATAVRRATWVVYDSSDDGKETRVGAGYATGTSGSYTYTLINPVSITKTDVAGREQEQIQATRASTSGKLLPADTFAQSSYTRWTTMQYTDCCFTSSQRVYHTIPATGTGSEGTNYDQTDFGYDVMKRRNRTETPGGTISFDVFDVRSLTIESWTGTDDTGATSSDPSGGGATGNNMKQITGLEYDSGNDAGNGNLTKQTQYVDASTTRLTTFTYDWRNRRTDIDGEIDSYQKQTYDNLDRVIKTERYDTTSSGNLISRSETKFDDLGRVYQSVRYGVDPSTGTVGNSLTDNTWFDAAGNAIKQQPPGSDLFSKTSYDSLGRSTTRYSGYDLDETSYADAGSVTGDTIMEQMESTYDDASNAIQTTTRNRYHNAAAAQTGELKNPSETPNARVTYSASYPDALGRTVATANYGTNGGTALTRSSTVPTRSDTILVTSTDFDSSGNLQDTTDPSAVVTRFEYDAVDRETKRIMNYVTGSSSSGSGSVDTNVTVHTAYNADGNVKSLTADNAATGNQKTEYIYGTTLSDSEVASSLLKRKEIHPDSVSSSDVILFEYNRQSDTTKITDPGGTVHEFDYDKLGRQTHDRVTTLGSGVDGAVRRISTTYEVRGMKATAASWNNASVVSGNVVNEVEFTYNNFGQLTHDYQAHSGTVNVSTTPKVQYAFANGTDNTVRPTTITYPDGRVVTYDYGASDSMPDALSRVASIADDDGSSTHLADYEYLGLQNFVEVDYTEPDVKYTLVGTAGGNDSDTGDIYHGLDRFGRIDDSYWYDYGSSADVDRIKYGYDRSGSRLWRENVVARSLSKEFDEKYAYDEIQRLEHMGRGTLNSGHSSLDSTTFAQDWALDETGNWSGFKQDDNGNGTWDLNQSRTSNDVNEITDVTETAGASWVTPVYSTAGNMTTMPQPAAPASSYSATYDAWNRLVKIVDGSDTVSEYEYDGAKRRVIQKSYVSGTLDETRHLYYTEPSKWQVVEERIDSSTDPDRQFVWGLRYIDDLILRDRDTTGSGTLDERLYGLQDANWNVTSLVNTSGTVQQRFNYDAYGMPEFLTLTFVASTNTKDFEVLYSGYRFEDATTLFHVRHRVLNVALGCWVQRDPIGYADSANLYQYGVYNPFSFRDHSGLSVVVVVVIVIIGVILIGSACVYRCDPDGSCDPFTEDESEQLKNLKRKMRQILSGPYGSPIPNMVAAALADCPLTCKYDANGPDGSPGSSNTVRGPGCPTQVVLANDFFDRTDVCAQYFTLFKECYRRAFVGDMDDTGMSDNRAEDSFRVIQDALGCAGHK